MATMLIAPDGDDYDNAGHCLVDLYTLETMWPIFVAPENFTDYLAGRATGWAP